MTAYKTIDVFTPTIPAMLTFVERDEFNDQLVDALRTPGMHVVVYGDYGVGKTTLIFNKLNQLYEHHVKTVCAPESTYEELCVSAFDQLGSFYVAEQQQKETSARNAKASLFGDLSAGVTKSNEQMMKLVRSTPQLLDPSNLASQLAQVNACWWLEDFQRLNSTVRQRVAQCMKVFTDQAVGHHTVKLIVTSNEESRSIWSEFPSLGRCIAPFRLGLMTDEQTQQIITTGCELLNIRMSAQCMAEIVTKAHGHPRRIHEECLAICQTNRIEQTVDDLVEVG